MSAPWEFHSAMVTYLPLWVLRERKDSGTGGLASIVIENVQQEPTDFDLHNDILGGQIRSEGYAGFDSDPRRADAFAAMLNGSVGVSLLHQLVGTADGPGLGAHEQPTPRSARI